VTETEIIDELSLVDINTTDALGTLTKLLWKYTFVDESIFTVHSVISTEPFSVKATNSFSISAEAFEKHFKESLKNAYYLVEEEQRDSEFIDGKLFGHVTQQLLPGQFVTYDGKYYMARLVSPTSGIILSRASDLYDGRKYYRQLREYKFASMDDAELISIRKIIDVEVAFYRHCFTVHTTGYLDMTDNNNLRSAKLVDFTGDPSLEKYVRNYKNKTIMRLMLPDTDINIRFTICMLLSEAFRSVFPNSWHYLAVTAKRPDDIEGMLNYLVYQLDIESDDEYIYFIEDSDMDLGLLEAIDRNLNQFMEIITDFLDWHFDKMREPESKDPILGEGRPRPEEERKRSMFVKMAERIRSLFGIKKEEVNLSTNSSSTQSIITDNKRKEPVSESSTAEMEYTLDDAATNAEQPEPNTGNTLSGDYSLDSEEAKEEGKGESKDIESEATEASNPAYEYYKEDEIMPDEDDVDYVHIDGTDIFDEDDTASDIEWLEESFKAVGITPVGKTRYQKECFLKFGFDEIDKRIQLLDTRNYLRVRGYSNNSLTKARKRDVMDRLMLDLESSVFCDFCGQPLSGISYEKITDGRLRCNTCTASAITTIDEFKDLFHRVLGMMEGTFNISFKVPISVKMTDARTIAKGAGTVYRPTEPSVRVLGYAQHKGGNYNLFFENGSPYLAAIDLIVHELTHIWQFINWKEADVRKIYGNESDLLYEGMASWAAIQYLYQIGESYYAELQERLVEIRNDVYGEGLRQFRERYPFVKDSTTLKYSPFTIGPPRYEI
jgi:hypothetical protein